MAQGGGVGPARARLSRLAGLVEDLVAPVSIGRCRPWKIAASDPFRPGCGTGLVLLSVRRLAGTRFRPGLLAQPCVLTRGTGVGRRPARRVAGGCLNAGVCVMRHGS